MPTIKQINGWKPWFYPKIIRNEYRTASAPFPSTYLPARAFLAETFASHCLLPTPWTYKEDPIDAFALAGGTNNLILALEGLRAFNNVLNDPQEGTWGIGGSQIGIPTVGFCMGDSYKEHTYFRYTATKIGFGEMLGTACMDVFQRSRLKRLYVMEGMVVRFVANPNPIELAPTDSDLANPQFVLTLDFEGVVPEGISTSGGVITVHKKGGQTISLTIKKILPNWEVVVTKQSSVKEEPSSGDFYKIESPWGVDDPYMMSGFFNKPESFGEYSLPSTTHNLPYAEVKFVGAYVYREKVGHKVISAAAGSPFVETDTKEWAWIYYTGQESYIYKEDPDRYFTVETSQAADPDFAGNYVNPTLKTFTIAELGDLATWKGLSGVNYVRMEIDRGGDSRRQNWHSPILTKCFLKQNGKYFAILGQPDGNVIDVSLKDVTGTTDLLTDAGTPSKILNQYAWMINEHYTQCGGESGFLEGNVKSATYNATTNTTTLLFENDKNSVGTITGNTTSTPDLSPNSFYNRFIKEFSDTAGLKKMWNKFQYWRVFDSNHQNSYEVIPSSVKITPMNPTTTTGITKVSVIVSGDASKNKKVGFYFDEPYARLGPTLLPVFTYTMTQGASDNKLLSTICVEMDYRTAIMSMTLPTGTIIGSTGGTWWGMGSRGLISVMSENNIDLFVTVPDGGKTVSSFFHYTRQQDWIFFQDVDTNRITIRTGNLNFTETPIREEVIIGLPDSSGTAGGFPITFDSSKERVKSITMKLPKGDSGVGLTDDFNPSALTFQVGSSSDYFGFRSTGSGVFNFVALNDNGFGPGTVDYSKYKANGNFISPVYIYKNRSEDVSFFENDTLELGIGTKDKLYVKNGSPTNIGITYVKDRQTLQYVPVFDAHHVGDGEIMLLYSKETGKFISEGKDYDPSKWPTTSSLYVVGTADNAFTWGTPLAKILNFYGDTNYQYPTMVLNSCQYLTSYYNDASGRFVIFLKCYQENTNAEFIGCLTLSRLTLSDDLAICNGDPDNTGKDLNFWIRKLKIPAATLTDTSKTYAPIETLLPSTTDTTNITDTFIRIIGPEGTNCQITADISEIGNISCTMLDQGTSLVLYSSGDGIMMLSSHNLSNWGRSKIILAKNGNSPLFFGENLYYIAPEGITMKSNILYNTYQASWITDNAGFSSTDIESIQEEFDEANTTLIGSGVIDSQRMAGHRSHSGIHKIMYYNSDNILCCLESDNTITWKMANNF